LNTLPPLPPARPGGIPTVLRWLAVLLAVAALTAFVVATPGGLLTKTDMIGYAVCHRIGSHSFTIAGRQLPLCARCSGTFMGALVGFFGQAVVLRRRRASEFPPPALIVVLVGFMGLWAADGLNSYMQLVGGPYVYQPQNWLRLTTGALNGLTMSSLVYPVLNTTLWSRISTERTLRNLKDLGVMVLLEGGLVTLVLTRWGPLLYPLAILSAAGVLALLTSVNSMLALMLVRRENSVDSWREAAIPFLAGFALSLIQVGAIDWVRFNLTGTLGGFPLP
jgi:uncharacterized membrane protein